MGVDALVKQLIRGALGRLPFPLRRGFSRLAFSLEAGLQRWRAARLKRHGMKELDVLAYKPGVEKSECHILGSGWSLNSSYPVIDRRKVFVIGFNFSFLKCPDPDLHFIENASLKNKRFFDNSLDHYFALGKFGIFDSTVLVVKNISEFKNSLKLIRLMYGDKALFVRDRHFRLFGADEVDAVIKQMMRFDGGIPQALSSSISLVFFARLMGFKRIVVHGLDFFGPHFYGEDLNQAIYHDYDFSQVGLDQNYQPGSGLHKSAAGENGVGVSHLLYKIKAHFEEEGIELVAATERSPSSEILGVRMDG